MKKNDLLHFYRNFQIIDVTEQCTFEWNVEPKPCKACLKVSDASGNFTEGETIQGQTSGATATVFSSYVNGSRVYVEDVSGAFQTGETVQGQDSGQTATVDSFVEERSYPNNVVKGIFPDSIISRDLDDYLEWETSLAGAGYSTALNIKPRTPGFYNVVLICGVGSKVDSLVVSRVFELRTRTFGGQYYITAGTFFDTRNLVCDLARGIEFLDPNIQEWWLSAYQLGKGTFRWRIHSIRVFKIII